MDFQVLGPLGMLEKGKNVAPTAPKPRQVIALLIMRRNAVVQTSELIDELWEGGPPTSALTTLQTYIYKLRKILVRHGGEEVLHTRPGGYVLDIPNSSVDLYRAEKAAGEGKSTLRNGDPVRARESLAEALAIWRAPALVDVDRGALLSSYATRLEEFRSRTLEMRIEADLQLGHHRELVSELKSLILTHPLHEHLHASLMIALHRSGRRHEALEVFRVLRQNMVEDLGLEPGEELRQLHQALLADAPVGPPFEARQSIRTVSQDAAASGANGSRGVRGTAVDVVDRSAAPQAAEHEHLLASVPAQREATGVSSEGRVRDVAPVPPSTALPSRSAPDGHGTVGHGTVGHGTVGHGTVGGSTAPAPAELPADVGDFTGRAPVIEDIMLQFLPPKDGTVRHAATRVVVIAGMPGVGKSALAVHLAHRVRHLFPDGQLHVELHGSTDGPRDVREVLHGLLRSLGIPDTLIPANLEERSKLFRSTTAARRVLLVLDDTAALADVRPLLPGGPKCAVIITSRRRLHGLAGAQSVDLDVLDSTEGIDLLASLIGRERLDEEPQAADKLVELGGWLPLALRCIGGRVATMPGLPLTRVADQLARSNDILSELRLGDLDVRSGYDAAYDRLTRSEQAVFRLLSMLPADEFTASTVADLLGWEIPSVERILDRFVNSYLLKIVHYGNDELHYALPPLTWTYARGRLDSTLKQDACQGPSHSG
ncbi:BTAD domain-containing putative transcriptional regulator [Streptomyces sp. NPDC005963]|uniref:AfsR/SARP family transcriptional regulator n=1 Tax=Streptomyces sp. NPDC005963 TaxID=3156721 RepID=UPI0033EE4D3E